jgi:hypothetical protein
MGTATSRTDDATPVRGGRTMVGAAGSYQRVGRGGNAWLAANKWPSNTPWFCEFIRATISAGVGPDANAFNTLFTNSAAVMSTRTSFGANIVTPDNRATSVTANDNLSHG